MPDNAPIKRHAALVPLSHDHHDALMLVLQIRKGVKNKVPANLMADYATEFFREQILPHFTAEETFLFTRLPATHSLRLRAELEHAEIRQHAASLMNSSDTYEALTLFASGMESHIRFEERELFAHFQETMPDEELEEIGSLMAKGLANRGKCNAPPF